MMDAFFWLKKVLEQAGIAFHDSERGFGVMKIK